MSLLLSPIWLCYRPKQCSMCFDSYIMSLHTDELSKLYLPVSLVLGIHITPWFRAWEAQQLCSNFSRGGAFVLDLTEFKNWSWTELQYLRWYVLSRWVNIVFLRYWHRFWQTIWMESDEGIVLKLKCALFYIIVKILINSTILYLVSKITPYLKQLIFIMQAYSLL